MRKFILPFSLFIVTTLGTLSLNGNDNANSLSANETESTQKIEPFTGKITRNKVRLRLQPSLDAFILREIGRDELVSVVGENDEFYAVLPPKDIKAYIFRTFVLDNVVEGSRVNVRLEPALEAPIIAQLHQGDHVDGIASPLNSKWLEIPPPESTRFYICKEYVEKIGPPEMLGELEKRLSEVNALLNSARITSEDELQKDYKDINLDVVISHLNKVIKKYSEFTNHVASAKELLHSIQEAYLQKKIAYLELKAKHLEEIQSLEASSSSSVSPSLPKEISSKFPLSWKEAFAPKSMSEKMALWIPQEEQLFEKAKESNSSLTPKSFYLEQLAHTVTLKGVLESYSRNIKNKPGDYLLVNPSSGLPLAYLYSTRINLENYIGKELVIHGLKRSNNNFAFPAYYVISVE